VPNNSPKNAVFDKFSEVAKALGNGHRLKILKHLAQGERGIDVLAQFTSLSLANTSQHLKRLRAIALLRKKGFKARRLEDGYPEWKADGFPTESGDVKF
jgi:DNA-binding transcriptional ArsR family regulator